MLKMPRQLLTLLLVVLSVFTVNLSGGQQLAANFIPLEIQMEETPDSAGVLAAHRIQKQQVCKRLGDNQVASLTTEGFPQSGRARTDFTFDTVRLNSHIRGHFEERGPPKPLL